MLKFKPLSKLLRMSSLCLMIGLSACANVPNQTRVVTVSVDNSCKAFGYISWSIEDTPESASQIKRHNRTYSTLCKK